jgi:hypothetical protein
MRSASSNVVMLTTPGPIFFLIQVTIASLKFKQTKSAALRTYNNDRNNKKTPSYHKFITSFLDQFNLGNILIKIFTYHMNLIKTITNVLKKRRKDLFI